MKECPFCSEHLNVYENDIIRDVRCPNGCYINSVYKRAVTLEAVEKGLKDD